MRLRTCWMRIAKRTMRYLAAITGLFLVLTLPQDTEAFHSVASRFKRSIDLNDVYHFKVPQHRPREEVVPISYHLELQPFVGNDKFNGRVKINVTWTDISDTIILNVHPDLHISKYNVRITETSFEEREKGLPLMDVDVARVDLPNSRKAWYVIQLEQILKKGSSCEVDISFTGNLTIGESRGLFRNEYISPYVATYLRLDQAQTVFPCMDEPRYKSTFKLSVLRPRNMTALSNTPLESTTESSENANFVWDHFEKTPNISTYQLALLVSDFESISPTEEVKEINGRKVEIKVWAPKSHLNFLKETPDKIVRIMNYLQEYFNSSIMLPKLDLVAMPYISQPADNWGLMFYDENVLSNPSVWSKAYELIYQWIGQYITPYRWSDAPVNKALNSFLASMTTVDINPDEMEGKWPMTMLYSLYYEFGKYEPFSRVGGIRNEATSSKTELVFRMLNYTLGKDLFQKGVRKFIKQDSAGNLRTFFADDIFSRLNDVVNETNILPKGLTINSIAGPWTNRDRVPLVTVIRDYETKQITFSQKVYLREAPRALTPKLFYQWDIPIIMMSEEKLEFHKPCPLWLTKDHKSENLTIPDITDEDHFIIVNPEEIGMFPVNYDFCNWKMLIQYLRSPNRENIPVLTRAKLLHDSWNLAYSGELCFGIALNMTLFLKEERSHVVWEPVFMMIDHIGRRLEGSGVYPKFEAYIRTLLKPLYNELKETEQANEPTWKTRMRGMAKNFLCRAGYEPCIIEARNKYTKWLSGEDTNQGKPITIDFICTVFKWGTEEEWEAGLQHIISFPQFKRMERTYLLKSLASCPKDTHKIERLLNITILDQNESFVDSDIQLIFVTLSSGAAGYRSLFNFLTDNWDTVKQRFEDKQQLWSRIIELATSTFSTQKSLDLVKKLYESYPDQLKPGQVSANLIIQEAFRTERKEWTEKNLPVIDSWLLENLPKEELEAIQTSTATTMMAPISME